MRPWCVYFPGFNLFREYKVLVLLSILRSATFIYSCDYKLFYYVLIFIQTYLNKFLKNMYFLFWGAQQHCFVDWNSRIFSSVDRRNDDGFSLTFPRFPRKSKNLLNTSLPCLVVLLNITFSRIVDGIHVCENGISVFRGPPK